MVFLRKNEFCLTLLYRKAIFIKAVKGEIAEILCTIQGVLVKLALLFFKEIRELILSARATVSRGTDLVQVHTSFEIGRRIVQEEQQGKSRADYGKEVIIALAKRLTKEFGNGFSERNLAYMRAFHLQYQERMPILQTASAKSSGRRKSQTVSAKLSSADKTQTTSGQIDSNKKSETSSRIFPARSSPFCLSWSHYVFLLGIKNADERSFYEIEAASQNWAVRELKRQFDSSLYERLALSRDKKGIRKLSKEGQIVCQPNDLLKEPLVLEFLGLDEQTRYSESDLETGIINQIEKFLLELGKGFLFEARQKRFSFDGDHFFVDLVFYNRLLRCYVLIDLKIGKLTHQDMGQMQTYVNYYNRYVKTDTENATIGIILCKKKSEALVEITLPKDANIHAREYQLYLPSKEELQMKLQEWGRE
jgi:predicted nuclease of restriction endonuclease-like (RecB) superfamily